jgi:protoporphyrinogen oxidase
MDEGMGPPGHTALCCDVTYDEGDPVATAGDDDLVRRCFEAVVGAGLTSPDKLEAGFVRRFKSFYPMYGIDYRERLFRVYERLRTAPNLVLTGRLGMFNYNNADHCLDMGRFIADGLSGGRSPGDIWTGLEERVRSYRIVD